MGKELILLTDVVIIPYREGFVSRCFDHDFGPECSAAEVKAAALQKRAYARFGPQSEIRADLPHTSGLRQRPRMPGRPQFMEYWLVTFKSTAASPPIAEVTTKTISALVRRRCEVCLYKR